MLFKKFTKRRAFAIIFLVVIILIKLFALNALWIENYYTSGFFKECSNFLRLVTGWLPFSIGDIAYFFAGIWILYKVIYFFVKLRRNKFKIRIVYSSAITVLLIAMGVYIIFNIFWGLNYNRKGIAYQLNLGVKNYTATDLKNIQQLLVEKVNTSKQILIRNKTHYPDDKELFSRANRCYQQSSSSYPFIKYKYASVKSSLYGRWDNFFGFTGYYNPFTGEAQVNTTVPPFVLPFTTCHEIAHQLGYAKEDEANFAGYLAATSSADTLFHYSTYLDMFLYANNEGYYTDSVSARQIFMKLSPEVKADIKEWRDFLLRHRSFADEFITWAYGNYLKANQQPEGMRSYNEVIAVLIAFYKKTGKIHP